jgi:glycosyltransferase involved in cell wall biosynthesis
MAVLGKITVITVVLNAAHSLEETIQSVLNCSRDNLEYIVIDGGSTDGTLEIIRRYAERLTYWMSEPDDGVYDAMNKGWRLADLNSWIVFLGAGDHLLSLPETLAPPRLPFKVLYGKVELAHNKMFFSNSGYRLKLYNSLHHQGMLVPKALCPEPPFNTSYRYYADFDFNQRLYKMGVSFEFEPSLRAYSAPDGITGDLQLSELLRIVKMNYGLFWWLLSFAGFWFARYSRVLNRLRPIK